MKPPTFSAEVSRSRHSRTDLLWRESVGVCRECGGDRGQGNVATNTNETTSRTGVIGITCEHQMSVSQTATYWRSEGKFLCKVSSQLILLQIVDL